MPTTNQGMLIKIKVRAWTATKVDKEIGEAAARQYSADEKKSGAYHKKLLDKSALKGVNSARTALRNFHLYNSLYWDDDGTRLVPFKKLPEYREGITALALRMEEEADNFTSQYESCIRDAQTRLGDMYRAEDYPTKDEVRKLFGVDVEFSPIPDGSFIPMDAPARDELIAAVEATTTAKLAEGTQNLFFRLRNYLVSMKEALTSYASRMEADDGTGRLHESLIDNLKTLVEVLPLLNITNDKFLDGAIDRVREEFSNLDISSLRGNPEAVRKVTGNVDKVLDSLPEQS